METRKIIIRTLTAFALSLVVGIYGATLSVVIMGILVLMMFLLGLMSHVPANYSIAVISGLAFGVGIASLMGWATPALIG